MWRWTIAVAALLVALPACKRDVAEVEEMLDGAVRAIDRAQAAQPPVMKLKTEVVEAKPSADQKRPPEDYTVMQPIARRGSYGNAVLLVDPTEDVIVPIYIGGTEALSIALRLEHRKFKRPLTHDLLDSLVNKLGAKMVRAQVDALHDNVYLGTVVFERGDELIELDARPSDAIALAIGNRVPIYVSRRLIEAAGIRPEDLESTKPSPKTDPVAL